MLNRWDPLREMMSLRNAMDRLFDSAVVGPQGWQPLTGWDMAMDVIETEDEYQVKASIPGINPDDIEITFTGNTLNIKGEVKEEKEVEEARYHLRERRYGSFARSVTIPTSVDTNAINASYTNGVLTLHLPKAEESKPKRIQVRGEKMLEGKAKDIKPSKN